MNSVPTSYPGPNAAGAPEGDIPYYSYGHVAGNYPDNVPGPWAAGGVPTYGPPAEASYFARYVFNNEQNLDVVSIYIYVYDANSTDTIRVDWGDGNVETLTPEQLSSEYITHGYATSGIHTVKMYGNSANLNELSVDLYDTISGGYYGPDIVEISSTGLEGLYIFSWPQSVTVDCPNVYFLEIGPGYYDSVGSSAFVLTVANALPSLSALWIMGSLDSAFVVPQLVLRGGSYSTFTLTYFGGSSRSIPSLTLSDVEYFSIVGYWNIGTLILDGCTLFNNSLYLSGLSSVNVFSCVNTTYSIMAQSLRQCVLTSSYSRTFTGTGNGTPSGQAATDAATLVSRGWTVTTD